MRTRWVMAMLCRRKMQAGPTSPCSTEYPCIGEVCATSSTSSGSPAPEPGAPERGFPSCGWSRRQRGGGAKQGPPPAPAAAPRGVTALPYLGEPPLRGLGAVAHGWGLPPCRRTCLAPGGLAGADRGAATEDLRFLWNIWGYAGQARGGGCRARVHNPPDYFPLQMWAAAQLFPSPAASLRGHAGSPARTVPRPCPRRRLPAQKRGAAGTPAPRQPADAPWGMHLYGLISPGSPQCRGCRDP